MKINLIDQHAKLQLIQQLRGLSILLVLFYHMGLPVESGFLGVDIFFFISGYIVSNVLSRKYFTQSNSLKLFYINRFWRLYPTLVASLIFTLFLALALQSGNEILSILKNVFYGLFGISNLVYYKESGIYGTSSTDNNPLIHLWSLSVEFQFYLLFPFLYWIIDKYTKKQKVYIIFFILILSLSLYNYSLNLFNLDSKIVNKNMFLFYLTPFRLFEFFFGVFVFHLLDFMHIKWNLISKITFRILFLLILYIFLTTNISDQNRHEKILFLMVLLGCILLVSKNMERSYKKWQVLLENLGFYAYSIYLIHLPMITLIHMHFPENKYVPIIAGTFSVPIGILITKKIENKQLILRSKKFMFLCGMILFLVSSVFWLTFGNSSYSDKSVENKIFTDNYLFYYNQSGCSDESSIGAINCSWNNKNNQETVFVVGDSQASFGLDAIVPAAKTQNLRVVSGARNGCPFIDDMVFTLNLDKCSKTRTDDWLWIRDNKPKIVIIANLSTGYLKTSRRTLSNPGGKCPDINGLGCKGYEIALRKTIKQIKEYGSKVILLQTIPNYTGQFERTFLDFNPEYTVREKVLSLAREPSYLVEVDLSKKNEIYLVDPFLYLCEKNKCPLKSYGKYLYANSFHISTEGAKLLIPRFSEIFKEINGASNRT